MEFIWILFAFIFGVLARAMSLPPLIGYLLAGFLLHLAGMQSSDTLQTLSDLGITLMLFTIGLKLNVRDLLKTAVWGGALSNMILWTLTFTGIAILPISLGFSHFMGLTWQSAALIGFALSFSSTVCVVKVLESSGDIKSRHGKLSVGILVMQDVIAVLFMAVAMGEQPSLWAFGLLALVLLRKPIGQFLDKVGHDELLPLAGFFLAFGGYELFSALGIKGDLGALVAGAMLSGSIKASELYRSLMSFKDLFLIGFFLSIGFTALPTGEIVVIALLLALLIPIKSFYFFNFHGLLGQRARTSYLNSLVLGNYSEFGLIVVALSISFGWLSKEWLVILALAVSFTFIITSFSYRYSHRIYGLFKGFITRFEDKARCYDDTCNLPAEAEVLVVGMGRVGKGAYTALSSKMGGHVYGLDSDEDKARLLQAQGVHVLFGDGEDADLWCRMNLQQIKLVLIALPSIMDIKNTQEQVRASSYAGKVVAIVRYEDQIHELAECGIDRIFNFYTEAGVGFADESMALLSQSTQPS
ncbi:MAG: cation:proton antiporter [Gammaproteobacteria bacterium]|nr:cation:proton antiporter [Gammaproteobacteria bacterium]